MNAPIKTTALVAIIAGSVLLSGCAITSEPPGIDAKPQPSATQPAETPATDAPVNETPTEQPTAKAPKAGDTISKEERVKVEEANPNISAYWMGGDDYVAVEADKPLPRKVQKAENKKAAGAARETGATVGEYEAIARDAKLRTGKNVIVIFTIQAAIDASDENIYTVYAIAGGDDALRQVNQHNKSLEGAIKRAKAFIAKQDNPDEWAIAHP